jgi:hypothetical protein
VALTKDILPNCITTRSEKTVVWPNGQKLIQLFCANCGKPGGLVMQTEYERINNFAFYLCDPCAEKWSPLVDTQICPDEAFWQKVREAQMEEFGRELNAEEIAKALADETHVLTKLCKDRHDLKSLI